MNIRNLIPWSYAVSIAAFSLAIYAKAGKSESLFTMFIIAMLVQFIFAALAIYELRGSEHFTRKEKADWTVLLLCAPIFFGTVYLFKLRRRILYL
jgi:hypothetical protein